VLQSSEVVDLVIALVLLPIIASSGRAPIRLHKRLLFASYLAVVCAYIFTIAEGFFWPVVFNILEHASYAGAGILAVAALLSYRRHSGSGLI